MPLGRRQYAAHDREQRRLAGARRSHQQGQFTSLERDVDTFEGAHLPRALAEILDDALCLQDHLFHRANTMAGSMRVTFMIAARAEIAHMNTVSTSSPTASPGVMMIGNAVFLLSSMIVIAIIMPSA